MTALELMRGGVVFERDAHASIVALDGPDALVGGAEAEVLRRVDAMRAPPRLAVATGRCDACGDAMAPFRGGWCELCTLARRVAVKRAGVDLP